jgi:hypothetical protein
MPKGRKSQMEIMGIAIIIIIVSLGLLFAVTWLLNAPAKPAQRAKESVLASNFLSTMLGTTTGCNQRTVRDLLVDCALTQGETKCGAENSCDYARDVIQNLFDSTFKVWKVDYYFHITGASSLQGIQFGIPGGCKAAKEGKTREIPVTIGYQVVVSLDICG